MIPGELVPKVEARVVDIRTRLHKLFLCTLEAEPLGSSELNLAGTQTVGAAIVVVDGVSVVSAFYVAEGAKEHGRQLLLMACSEKGYNQYYITHVPKVIWPWELVNSRSQILPVQRPPLAKSMGRICGIPFKINKTLTIGRLALTLLYPSARDLSSARQPVWASNIRRSGVLI